LEFTTKIASTVVLELFFGGGKINIEEIQIEGRHLSTHMRELLLHLEEQLISSPMAMILGEKYTKLGVTKLDKNVNRLLAAFHNFTHNFVQQRLSELKAHYKEGREHPENYTDIIEAFYV
jgi:hypothetical protein